MNPSPVHLEGSSIQARSDAGDATGSALDTARVFIGHDGRLVLELSNLNGELELARIYLADVDARNIARALREAVDTL